MTRLLIDKCNGDFLLLSLEAKESKTNWKLDLASMFVLYKLASNPKICADEMFMSPVRSKGRMSTFAPIREAEIIFFLL